MGSTLKNEVKSGSFTDVPNLLESKLSDKVISRGLGTVKFPDDKAAAESFSITASEILRRLSVTHAEMGKYNTEKKKWGNWLSSSGKQEEEVCQYLNQIADHVYKEFGILKEHGGSRLFSDMFKNSAPSDPGVNSIRKPDGVVLDQKTANASRKGGWRDIHAIMEFKKRNTPKNSSEVCDQLLNCARMVFCSQMNRRFVLGVTLAGNMMTFYVFDRSGVLSSEKFNIMKKPDKLIRVAIGLLFADHIDLGYDPTIVIYHKVKKGTSTENKLGEIIFQGKPYPIKEILYVESSVRGRGTMCFVINYNNELCVIKDSWVDESRTTFEDKVLERVSTVKGIPKIIAAENVKARKVEDTTATDRLVLKDKWHKHDKWKGFGRAETRAHRRILMTPYGKPLESFTSLVELLTAIKNIIETIESLYDKDVLHRDISIRNLVLALLKGEKDRRGYIIDFDYAIFSEERTSDHAKGQRTGTLPFMALEMMQADMNAQVLHDYYHDLESVFYVLCWICTKQGGPNGQRRPPSFKFEESEIAKWAGSGRDDPDMELVALMKAKTVEKSVYFEKAILGQIAPYFRPLWDCLEDMRSLLIFNAPPKFRKDKGRAGIDHAKALLEWKERNVGEDPPLEMLANIPPSEREAKDVFKALYGVIDATLADLVEPPAPSLRVTSVSDNAGDAYGEFSTSQGCPTQTEVVNTIDNKGSLGGQEKAEDEERKRHKSIRNVRRSPRFTENSRDGPSIASTSGALLSSSAGTKRPTSPVELETRSTDSAKKRKYVSKEK